MNRSGLRKMLGAGALLACLGTTAPAYAEGSCPRRVGMGQWSFTETGTIILPTGTIPFGAVGVVTVDARVAEEAEEAGVDVDDVEGVVDPCDQLAGVPGDERVGPVDRPGAVLGDVT